jgi:hypothetical protein
MRTDSQQVRLPAKKYDSAVLASLSGSTGFFSLSSAAGAAVRLAAERPPTTTPTEHFLTNSRRFISRLLTPADVLTQEILEQTAILTCRNGQFNLLNMDPASR